MANDLNGHKLVTSSLPQTGLGWLLNFWWGPEWGLARIEMSKDPLSQ